MNKMNFKRWQIKKLLLWFIAVVFLGGGYICYATHSLYNDKTGEEMYWQRALNDTEANNPVFLARSKNATWVNTGTYLESIREINMRSSYFRVIASVAAYVSASILDKAIILGLVLLVLRFMPQSVADYLSIDKNVPVAVIEDDGKEDNQKTVNEK